MSTCRPTNPRIGDQRSPRSRCRRPDRCPGSARSPTGRATVPPTCAWAATRPAAGMSLNSTVFSRSSSAACRRAREVRACADPDRPIVPLALARASCQPMSSRSIASAVRRYVRSPLRLMPVASPALSAGASNRDAQERPGKSAANPAVGRQGSTDLHRRRASHDVGRETFPWC